MKEATALAKIILGTLGIYLLIRWIPQVIVVVFMAFQNVYVIGQYNLEWQNVLMMVAGVAFTLLWGFLIVWFLLIRRDWLAGWVTKGIELPVEASGTMNWVPFGYRLACFVGGLIFLFHSTVRLAHTAMSLLALSAVQRMAGTAPTWGVGLLGSAVVLAIGIYLLCGAPGFVEWQVRRTTALMQEGRD